MIETLAHEFSLASQMARAIASREQSGKQENFSLLPEKNSPHHSPAGAWAQVWPPIPMLTTLGCVPTETVSRVLDISSYDLLYRPIRLRRGNSPLGAKYKTESQTLGLGLAERSRRRFLSGLRHGAYTVKGTKSAWKQKPT